MSTLIQEKCVACLRSALVRWEDEGGSWLPLTEP